MIKNRLIRETLLLTAIQLFLDTASLLLNGFMTRQLGASAIGIFSLMGSFLGLAGIISNGNAFLCTSRLISEELGRSGGDPNRVLLHGIKLCLLLSVSVSALIVVLSGVISERFFSGAAVASAVRLMPAALISGALSSCFKGYLNACRKASSAAVGDILEFLIRAAVIVCFSAGKGTHSDGAVCRMMILSIIAGNLFSLGFVLVVFARNRVHSPNAGTLSFRDYAGAAFPIMGGGVLTAVLSSANDALVPVCLRQYGDSSEQALALFGIFEAIVIPTIFFPSVVLCSMSGMIVTESARASAAKDHARIRSITSRLIEYTMIYAVFAAAVLVKFGAEIGELLGGGESAGKMIAAIAPVVPFIYMEIVLEAVIKGLGQQSFSSLNYLAEYVIRIAAVLILVPKLGFAGIAVSYYASNIFGNTSRFIKVLRCTGVSFKLFRMMISPVVYAVMTMSAAELICRFLGVEGSGLPAVIFFVTVWGGLYGLVYVFSIGYSNKDGKSGISVVQGAQ